MRRLYILLLIVSMAVAAVLLVVFHREREPEYGGKKLSEWVEERGLGVTFINGPQIFMPKEGADAVREIGTNAIPFLLEWIRYEPPAWKTKSLAAINRIFHSTLIDRRALRADGATGGFLISGQRAEAAIPRLAVLMDDPKATNSAWGAAMILSSFTYEAHYFDKARAPQSFVTRALLEAFRDPDPSVRIAATNALRRLNPEALEPKRLGE